jgi:A/G-specific adenine glycosylase
MKQFNLTESSGVKAFQKHLYEHFDNHGRILPWRKDYNPYHIYISEVMLQQTQVDRVSIKFEQFIDKFKNFKELADSNLEELYSTWQGLGYNRRAASLREAARIITNKYKGVLPDSPDILIELPGIGAATAASITAFAFNKPVIFLETNIRTVFIYHFFPSHESVPDDRISDLVTLSIDKKNPRKWYSALMDYGTMLKKEVGNLSRKSVSYKKQSPFQGSRRQVRGKILKTLLEKKELSKKALLEFITCEETEMGVVLTQLVSENLVQEVRNSYRIAD